MIGNVVIILNFEKILFFQIPASLIFSDSLYIFYLEFLIIKSTKSVLCFGNTTHMWAKTKSLSMSRGNTENSYSIMQDQYKCRQYFGIIYLFRLSPTYRILNDFFHQGLFSIFKQNRSVTVFIYLFNNLVHKWAKSPFIHKLSRYLLNKKNRTQGAHFNGKDGK